MKKATNSNLNRRILLTLSKKSASSVTALARDLGLLRPSVSRSVNALQESGLIARQGHTLLLTEEGQEEVQRLSIELPAMVKKAADQAAHTLARVAEQQSLIEAMTNTSSILAISELTASPLVRAAQAQSSFIQAVQVLDNSSIIHAISGLGKIPTTLGINDLVNSSSMQSIGVAIQGINIATFASQLGETIAAVVQTQKINLDFLQIHESPFNSFGPLFIENNVFISSMIADLGTIASAGSVLNNQLSSLGQLTLEATKAYDVLFKSASETLARVVTPKPMFADILRNELMIPTTTTSSLVGSTRNIIRAQSSSSEESSRLELTQVRVYSQQYTAMSIQIERYLRQLNERFVSKWHGAWQTLSSKSEDRYSQAMHSGSELLIQILAYLAPNEIFSEEEIARNNGKPPTRRMRIRRILDSDSKAEWIDKTAAALDSTYDVLTAESHNRQGGYLCDDTAAGQLIVLGGLLLTLLSKRNDDSP